MKLREKEDGGAARAEGHLLENIMGRMQQLDQDAEKGKLPTTLDNVAADLTKFVPVDHTKIAASAADEPDPLAEAYKICDEQAMT